MSSANVLFVMTDQQRFDSIAALGNQDIYTPNFDRLVRRGLSFSRAYSPCPVCVAARYAVRTGRDPRTTRSFTNGILPPAAGQPEEMEERCGPFVARRMRDLGYRTFGVGKFHSNPRFGDLGYDVHLHSEELYGTPEFRERDSYASFIAREHPSFAYLEQLQGERTEMYYVPQTSPMPAELTVEAWAADRAVEQLEVDDPRPYFGFVSFIGPHPPFAPPIPFNRLYDPDRMPNPTRGDLAIDHMDEQIPWMNRRIWADEIGDAWARMAKARYYGEITYIDDCLGRILDVVEARDDADDTVICFFTDHGDHLGDHSAWQKESFFDVSCRIPFLVSWPARLPADERREELASLIDLFGIATTAAGQAELRDGCDLVGAVEGGAPARERVYSYHGVVGGGHFKIMLREGDWKYIFLANGEREQLFNLRQDPWELEQRVDDEPELAKQFRATAAAHLASHPGGAEAVADGDLRAFPFEERSCERIIQMDASRGVRSFPETPEAGLRTFREQQAGAE